MQLFDHFGFVAPFYDRFASVLDTSRLEEFLAMDGKGSLLDAAGGTGRIGQALHNGVENVVVVDLSKGMLKQASEKNMVLPAQAQVEMLPFPGACFERIVMVDALHHVINQPATASELWRVLKPGGRLVIEEPNIHTLAAKMVAAGEKMLLMRSHFLSPQAIARLFPVVMGRTSIFTEGWNSWIVIQKPEN